MPELRPFPGRGLLKPDRVRSLLVLEIRRLVQDLEARRDLLVRIWGKHRARAPFLDSSFTRWKTLGFSELAVLDPAEIEPLDAFYRELSNLQLYLAWTEDMPRQLSLIYDQSMARLRPLAEQALTALGEPPLEPAPLPWGEE